MLRSSRGPQGQDHRAAGRGRRAGGIASNRDHGAAHCGAESRVLGASRQGHARPRRSRCSRRGTRQPRLGQRPSRTRVLQAVDRREAEPIPGQLGEPRIRTVGSRTIEPMARPPKVTRVPKRRSKRMRRDASAPLFCRHGHAFNLTTDRNNPRRARSRSVPQTSPTRRTARNTRLARERARGSRPVGCCATSEQSSVFRTSAPRSHSRRSREGSTPRSLPSA